jgi:hypothetical protein
LKNFGSIKYMKIKKTMLHITSALLAMAAVGAMSVSATADAPTALAPCSLDWDGDRKVSMTDLVAAAKAGDAIELAKIKYIIIKNIEVNFDDITTEPTATTTETDLTSDPIIGTTDEPTGTSEPTKPTEPTEPGETTADITTATSEPITTTEPTGEVTTDPTTTESTGEVTTEPTGETTEPTPTTTVDPNIIPTEGNVIILNYESISYTGDVETDINGSYITIKEPGDYEIFGVLTDGRIIVDVDKSLYPDGKVSLKLNGVYISSSDGPAILCNNIDDKLVINSKKNTENYLSDGNTRAVEGELDAVIYCDGDLNLKGEGLLDVRGTYADGIVSKKDIEVKTGANIKVTAQDDGIRGKNSVTLEDEDGTGFTLDVLAIDGDAIKATETDQDGKGFVEIQGGNTTLESMNDEGIQAATDFRISGGTLNITASAGNGIKTELDDVIFGNMSASDETINVTINSYGDGVQAASDVTVYGGVLNITTSAGDGIQAENSAIVNGGDVTITTSDGTDTDPFAEPTEDEDGTMQRPNRLPPGEEVVSEDTATVTDTVSAKGIKAVNGVRVTGGTIVIKSADDAINSDFEVTVAGGNLTLSSGDDAIHADATLAIYGATEIDILTAYEGIEGKEVYVSGGNIKMKVWNDGINAAGGNDSSATGVLGTDVSASYEQGGGLFSMRDGTLYIEAGGDGIDSNGNLMITGGKVTVIRNSLSANSVFDAGDFGAYLVIDSTAEVFAIGGRNEMPINVVTQTYSETTIVYSLFDIIRVMKDREVIAEISIPEFVSEKVTVIYSNQDIRQNGSDGYSFAYINTKI